jgi:hypothetical protein
MAIQPISLQAKEHYNFIPGGIKEMTLWESDNIHDSSSAASLEGTFVNSDTANTWVGVAADIPDGAEDIKSDSNKSKMTVSATQEKGLMLYTISVELSFPYKSNTLTLLNSYRGKALGAYVTVNNKDISLSADANAADNIQYLIGAESILGTLGNGTLGETGAHYSDFALFLDSIESDSGSKPDDGSSVTAKFTCVQGAPPAVVTFS